MPPGTQIKAVSLFWSVPYLAAVAPGVAVAVLVLTLVVEAVNLGIRVAMKVQITVLSESKRSIPSNSVFSLKQPVGRLRL